MERILKCLYGLNNKRYLKEVLYEIPKEFIKEFFLRILALSKFFSYADGG